MSSYDDRHLFLSEDVPFCCICVKRSYPDSFSLICSFLFIIHKTKVDPMSFDRHIEGLDCHSFRPMSCFIIETDLGSLLVQMSRFIGFKISSCP